MSVLELDSVTKRYGRRAALDGVTISVRAGTALGLLGPNGAGKTTALRLLLGFTRADTGRVSLQGCDPLRARSRYGVGFLPERLRLPGALSLRRFLRLHGRLANRAGPELEREIDGIAELTGLRSRLGERLDHLSKGLAQRVGFAQALLGNPRVLILDEPTTGLDPLGVREARGWLEAARARGTTLLVSSHTLSEIERLCDHVAILDQGRVADSGPLERLVRSGESLEDAFVRIVRPELEPLA